ncbi:MULTISPECIES: glycosyltransferase family 4 protein [unclassified Solwaraspora]|uniref:glycosyltransferase family 4 protein n=1 Tax=unclassified Solwaraspora TaxID=2627926 RepID=UPI00248ABCE7|nr:MULTISPECIES: glycosyltransferase family 4 protein [unclassified Solwaraspora]WBC00027.1 glycosyltransferase family 4 protein [Solwaraspora sp. WMMA2059]WBC21427.1 glycosyltransferase family 4 protein [Solwaraspora sp. WMMA2080]WJK36493.1 glycosyltransferase family 4 protein [Solwaraspora sp. WMMA2065]
MSPAADVIDIRAPRSQRILMLSWEYPPVVVGGLGRHVHALSVALANAGHEVTVVTRHATGAPLEEYADGVRIIRAAEDPPLFPLATPSLLAWTMAFNHTLTRAALRATQTAEYDVIHAHDWLVTHTAVTLKEHLDIPLVATIHATEAGRHQGWLPDEMNKSIHSIEHWLGHESCRVIACSGYMRWEVSHLLELPASRVDVIANGVNDRVWRSSTRAVAAARERYAADGPLIGFAGRLVYEKGVQHLIAALPWLRQRHPGLRVIVAGDGPYRGELQAQAARLGVADLIYFAGFMTESQLPAVLGATDATVVPSLYEPFGMVALEAAAAGAPLAVSATGGLAEIVEPGVTGTTFRPQDPHGLAQAVHTLLSDELFARRVARSARQLVTRRYGWATIAAQTAATYAAAVREAPGFNTRRAAAQLAGGAAKLVVPDGNLLAAVGGAVS